MPDQPIPLSPQDIERRRLAEDALRRVNRESEAIGTSAHARQESVTPDDDGAVELWGRRIGRSLGVIAALVFLWQLAMILFAGK